MIGEKDSIADSLEKVRARVRLEALDVRDSCSIGQATLELSVMHGHHVRLRCLEVAEVEGKLAEEYRKTLPESTYSRAAKAAQYDEVIKQCRMLRKLLKEHIWLLKKELDYGGVTGFIG